jgi:glucan phosphoethanolaminetransferase (alkaline phosphatase superfamily)
MFQFLYELLCGVNIDPTYVTDVYPFVGLFTLILAVVFCAVFYLALGRWKPIWDKLLHWIITILILIGIAVLFALSQSKGAIGADSYDSYMIKFSLVNALYAVVYFIVLSFLLKKASIFAKRTPF